MTNWLYPWESFKASHLLLWQSTLPGVDRHVSENQSVLPGFAAPSEGVRLPPRTTHVTIWVALLVPAALTPSPGSWAIQVQVLETEGKAETKVSQGFCDYNIAVIWSCSPWWEGTVNTANANLQTWEAKFSWRILSSTSPTSLQALKRVFPPDKQLFSLQHHQSDAGSGKNWFKYWFLKF